MGGTQRGMNSPPIDLTADTPKKEIESVAGTPKLENQGNLFDIKLSKLRKIRNPSKTLPNHRTTLIRPTNSKGRV